MRAKTFEQLVIDERKLQAVAVADAQKDAFAQLAREKVLHLPVYLIMSPLCHRYPN